MVPSRVISFFLPDTVGGVESVIRNIINFAPLSATTKVEIVLYSNICEKREPATNIPRHVLAHRFNFHCRDNSYVVARRFRAVIHPDSSVIVATDYLELMTIEIERLDTKVVYIVLGDFSHYYKIAKLHEGIIDTYIAISHEIYLKLCDLLPARKNSIKQFYFPTPPVVKPNRPVREGDLRIIFVARLEKGKNAMILPKIDDILISRNVRIEWIIVGDGTDRESLEKEIGSRTNFSVVGFVGNEELQQMYLTCDIFLMTSFNEGLPVSLIESMKTGLVPIVSDIPGGIREVVVPDVEGYLCHPEKPEEFAISIIQLSTDRDKMVQMSLSAERSANKKFNHRDCGENYWNTFLDPGPVDKVKRFSFRGSFLDKKFLPNALVRIIRSFKK